MKPLPCYELDSGHLVRRMPTEIIKIEGRTLWVDIPVTDVPQAINALAMCAGVTPINTESPILDYLRSLGGFDGWWDSIDEDTQNTIRKQLARILIGPSR